MWRFNEVIPDFKNLNIRVHQNVKSDNDRKCDNNV